jgi:hypothetical protein
MADQPLTLGAVVFGASNAPTIPSSFKIDIDTIRQKPYNHYEREVWQVDFFGDGSFFFPTNKVKFWARFWTSLFFGTKWERKRAMYVGTQIL